MALEKAHIHTIKTQQWAIRCRKVLYSKLLFSLVQKTINFSKSLCLSTRCWVIHLSDNSVTMQSGSEILYNSWRNGNTSRGSKCSLVHHSSVYPGNNFGVRQERSSLSQLGQQRVGGGAQVLKEVLETLEMSDDLRRDTQRLSEPPQNLPVSSRVKQQGQVLDWVIIKHLDTLTWTESEQEWLPTRELIYGGMNLLGGHLFAYLEPLPILSEVFAPSDIDTEKRTG